MRRSKTANTPGPARIEYLKVENYRALASVEFKELTPMTVLLGPNGSGKSTVFDVFNFLAECFRVGLKAALEKRGRLRELRTRGQSGPVVFELTYRESPERQPATYHLEIDEDANGPRVTVEWLKWRRVSGSSPGAPFKILNFKNGTGWVISGEKPEKEDKKVEESLDEPDLLASSACCRTQWKTGDCFSASRTPPSSNRCSRSSRRTAP